MSDAPGYPRLTYLRIKNYRALRDVELHDLTPLTVFIGPNGSGKSTILDALAFLAEVASGNLQQAWEKRNRFAGMRTRGSEGPIGFEVVVLNVKGESIRYALGINEEGSEINVSNEELSIINLNTEVIPLFTATSKPRIGATRHYLHTVDYWRDGRKTERYTTDDGVEVPENAEAISFSTSPLPNLGSHRIRDTWYKLDLDTIHEAISSYRYIHLTDDHLKGYSDAGPREKLSANGDNLPNVLYYLHERYPEALARITAQLRRWVPQLADVVPEITSDERLLLRFKDAAFEKPLPAQYMSDGTMRLAALLTLLYEPNATGLLGLEEPENELHPRLLPRLAEELIQATETRQLLVATHSPALLNSMEPEQVWILHRGADGYTQASRVADMPDIVAMVEEGSPLGYLWSRNFFEVGDPLASPSATPTQE